MEKEVKNKLLSETVKTKNNLIEGPILKSLITLSVPIIFSNILQTAYQLTDTFWVGRLGTVAVAAVSVSFPIIFLIISLGGGLAMAGTILVAQYKGKEDKKTINHITSQTLLMVFVISMALIGLVFVGGAFVATGRITPGNFIAFMLLVLQIAVPGRFIGWLGIIMQNAQSAAIRLNEIFKAPIVLAEHPQADSIGEIQGNITFENVSFDYEGKAHALRSEEHTSELQSH